MTKNHFSVVAASCIRFRTRSLPRLTAVAKPKVGTSSGSGRSLSMVLGTWATASWPASAAAICALAKAVSFPPMVTR